MSRVLPFDCDALLPEAERYASPKFRRVAQRLELRVLDFYDLVELVAFVEAVGLKQARYILRWRGYAVVRAYRRIRKHVGSEAEASIHANMLAMGTDSGLAILQAMREGGWTHGKLPWNVKMALKDLRKRGHTIADIARNTGLTREQVKTGCDVRRKGEVTERAAAYAILQ